MAKLVPRVEVAFLRYKDEVIDEGRVRELFEWDDDDDDDCCGPSGGGLMDDL